MPSGDVWAIKLHMTFADQQCRPGFYLIEGAGSGDTNPARGVAADVRSELAGGAALAGFSAATTLDAVEAQDVQPGTSRSYVASLSVPLVGDVADDNPVPPQDSMLIRWVTDFKGGKGKFARRARTYVPGVYSTGQVSGFLISDLQDALSAFASLIFDAYVSDGTRYQLFAVAFVPHTNPRVISETHPITSFTVDNQVDIIRRRRPGRGI